MGSLHYLMRNAVDYAGLFPPAALPMTQVVENFSRYITCGESSMLGRLIIPALKLKAFQDLAKELLPTDSETSTWKISSLVPPIEDQDGVLDSKGFEQAFEAINQFNQAHDQCDYVSAVVDAVEIKALTPGILKATLAKLIENQHSKGIRVFLEIPHQTDPSEMIEMIAEQAVGLTIFAKIRTGGVEPQLIPPASEVARFIHACAKYELGFKATAGLHHPIRANHKLTYKPDAPTAMMHGFLNVFVAAAIAFENQTETKVLEEILTCTSADAFSFEEDKLTWNDISVPLASIADTREHGLVSFGSCSFVEPTEELARLPGISRDNVFAE